MALVAGYIGMATRKCEMGTSVVIEGGRNPSLGIVAIAAVGFTVLGDELRIVGVVVASLARLWSAFEARLIVGGGLMAFTAGHCAMRANQRELGLGMIESVDVCPGT